MRSLFTRWLRRHTSDERLVSWLDGELSPRRARRVARHLDRCEECRRRMNDLDEVQRLFQEHHAVIKSNPDLRPEFSSDFERRLGGIRYEFQAAPSRIYRRAAWALLFSGTCLAVAAGLPNDAAHLRAGVLEIWNSLFSRPLPKRIDSPGLALRIPLPAVPKATVNPVPTRHKSISVSRRPARPSVLERDVAEIDARYALHRVRACMGEQIEYSDDASGDVLIRALVDTDARKQKLQKALEGIPWLHARIRTIQESVDEAHPVLAAKSFREDSSSPGAKSNHLTLVVPNDMPRERFLEISRDAIADSSLCMQHAWAVRRLESAYPEARVALLPPDSRRKLTAMLTEHASEWRQTLALFEERIAPILKAQPVAPSHVSLEDPIESVGSLFAESERLDRLTRVLFSDYNGPLMDVGTAVPAFTASLDEIQTALRKPEGLSSPGKTNFSLAQRKTAH